jgi:hypothetical protein
MRLEHEPQPAVLFDNAARTSTAGTATVPDTVTGRSAAAGELLFPEDYRNANQAAARLKDGDCKFDDNSAPGDVAIAD